MKNPTAVFYLAALFLYYEIFRWLPLGKFNWVFAWPFHNDQFYPDIAIGILLLLFIWSFSRANRIGMWIGTSLLGLWVGVHLFDWWIPYARSLPENYPRYRFYSAHTQVLPVIGNHYPPDAGHAFLDFFVFASFVFCLAACLRRSSRSTSADRSART